MDSSAFSGLGKMLTVMMVLLVLFIPLGVWKLVEIIIWLFKHIKVDLQ